MAFRQQIVWHLVKRGYAFKADSALPIITVPKYMEASIKQHDGKTKNRIRDIYKQRASQGNRRVPVISCLKNPKLNFYFGQTYPRTRRGAPSIPLASDGWRRAKYQNDEITFRAYVNNQHYKKDAEPTEIGPSFEDLGLSSTVRDAIQSMAYKRPTEIQTKAIPSILSGNNVVCSAETGSGKSLAYLAPLMNLVMKEKQKDGNVSYRRSPRAIIVVPGRELAEQIGGAARKLGDFCGVGVATMIGGAPKYLIHSGYDIVVTTIGLILEHTRKGGFLSFILEATLF